MTWFKVDDGFARHPKVKALRSYGARVRSDALMLWLLAGAECASALGQGGVRDGYVDADDLADLARPMPAASLRAATDALVDVGLWLREPRGFVFHDWQRYQPTSEKIKQRRDGWREQKAQQRSGNGHVSAPDSAQDTSDVRSGHSGESAPESAPESPKSPSRARAGARPVPSRPDPTSKNTRADLHQVARASDLPGEPALGLVLGGFRSRWEAKHRDAWMGPGKHRGLADDVARALESGAITRERLELSLEGFFSSEDRFVGETRHRFVTWASDVGRWIPTRIEPNARAIALPMSEGAELSEDEQRRIFTGG